MECYRLAKMYATGDGVSMNKYKAMHLLEKACAGGVSDGCYYRAMWYGGNDDIVKKYYYKKACELGNQDGCKGYKMLHKKVWGTNPTSP